MTDAQKDTGLIVALAERMETQRIPRALDLKERVDRGEKLSSYDINFLEEVFADARQIGEVVERHPEWKPLAAKLIHLYNEITKQALANEEAGAK